MNGRLRPTSTMSPRRSTVTVTDEPSGASASVVTGSAGGAWPCPRAVAATANSAVPMPTGQGTAQPSLRNFSTRPPTTAERFSEHLHAASAALGQSRAGLLRREVRALELSWNLQVRSCQPGPLRADIVHVREDRRNGA